MDAQTTANYGCGNAARAGWAKAEFGAALISPCELFVNVVPKRRTLCYLK